MTSCGLLTLTILLALPVCLWAFDSRFGENGSLAVGLAAAICWLAGLLALGVHFLFRDPRHAIASAFGGMLVRTAFVFAWAFIVLERWKHAEEAGFRLAVVVFFLLTLTTETALSLWMLKSQSAGLEVGNVEKTDQSSSLERSHVNKVEAV